MSKVSLRYFDIYSKKRITLTALVLAVVVLVFFLLMSKTTDLGDENKLKENYVGEYSWRLTTTPTF